MEKILEGTIFDIKRYALHDGPGIRTTVFMKGCPIRCRWCANPESQKTALEIVHLKTECVKCGRCEQICPEKAVGLEDNSHRIKRADCSLCGSCTEACPADALQIMGRTVVPETLFKEVTADAPFWGRSAGGVTLSGGEPLLQPDFSRRFLELCGEHYIHTTVESCLHVSETVLRQIAPLVDTLIFDLKHMDDESHRTFTGVSNERILANASCLLENHGDVLVRMPLIPGVNDDETNLEMLGGFLQDARKGVELELLPYHRLGESKYERLGRTYPMPNIRKPSKEMMDTALGRLKKFNINLVKR